jgi:hypothetical protein
VPQLGLDFTGRIDVVHTSDDRVIVEDLKTGKRAVPQRDADVSSQLAWYAMLWRYETGRLPDAVGLRSVTERGSEIRESTRTEDDLARLLSTIEVAWQGISAGIFPPAHEGAWWCSPQSCGYHSDCQFRS